MPDDRPHEVVEREDGIIIPPRKKPADDNGYFEKLTMAVFQAGFSWKVIIRKWANFVKAFDGFNVEYVAGYDFVDIERLLGDAGIVRNRQKIEATIHNARVFLGIVDEYGSFHAYLRSLDDLPYAKRRDAIAKQFKWLGRTGTFALLYMVDENVPDWHNR